MKLNKTKFANALMDLGLLTGADIPERYADLMLNRLEKYDFTDQEIAETILAIETVNLYGKMPTLAQFLKYRTNSELRITEIPPERQAAIEWEKVMDNQHTYICRDDHTAQAALPSCTAAVLAQYDTVDAYGNRYCGWYNLREDYRVAERSQKQWIRKGFIEQWLSFYYGDKIASNEAKTIDNNRSGGFKPVNFDFKQLRIANNQ